MSEYRNCNILFGSLKAKYKCLKCGEVIDPFKIKHMTFCKCGALGVDIDYPYNTYVRVAFQNKNDFKEV